jgi:hypothetical protein
MARRITDLPWRPNGRDISMRSYKAAAAADDAERLLKTAKSLDLK